jgi:hypothetical protein
MNNLSIFTTCKPMVGLDAIHQDNAIRSWLALEPTPQVIVYGDEEGVKEYCDHTRAPGEWRPYGLFHGSLLTYTRYGKPQVNELFDRGVHHEILPLSIYINADVCMFQDLVETCNDLAKLDYPFIASGQRLNLDCDVSVVTFAEMRSKAISAKNYLPPTGADYFIMPARWATPWTFRIPDGLGIGHLAWDNFIPWAAVHYGGATFIDVTRTVTAVHQNHPESNFDGHPGAAQNHRIVKSIVPPDLHATCGLQLPQALKW